MNEAQRIALQDRAAAQAAGADYVERMQSGNGYVEPGSPMDTPINRILADNDPANGTIAERIVRMLER
jgi:hypothetical protein